MLCNKLLQGFLTICLINLSVAEIPAIALPLPSSHSQVVAQATSKLTESAIRKVLEDIKMSREKEDIDGILKYLAPFAYTEVTVESEGGSVTMNFEGKDEHRNLLQVISDIRNASKTLEEAVTIDISADGQYAVARLYTLREITDEKGDKIITSSTDLIRFGLLDAQPMIVSADIKGWLSYRPAMTK